MGERLEQALAEAAKIEALHYTYRVEWSPEDREYVGLVAEFPLLSWLEESPVDAMVGIVKLVEEIIEDMTASGETNPDAVADGIREVGEIEGTDPIAPDDGVQLPAHVTMDNDELRALMDAEARAAEEAPDDDDGEPLPAHVTVSRPNRARSRVLQVRLNPEEYEALERLAEDRGLPMSTIARALLLGLLDEQAGQPEQP